MLGTNPWFKKPRVIGEKVASFRMVLKGGSGARSKKIIKVMVKKANQVIHDY
jgi:hypothetical protein